MKDEWTNEPTPIIDKRRANLQSSILEEETRKAKSNERFHGSCCAAKDRETEALFSPFCVCLLLWSLVAAKLQAAEGVNTPPSPTGLLQLCSCHSIFFFGGLDCRLQLVLRFLFIYTDFKNLVFILELQRKKGVCPLRLRSVRQEDHRFDLSNS